MRPAGRFNIPRRDHHFAIGRDQKIQGQGGLSIVERNAPAGGIGITAAGKRMGMAGQVVDRDRGKRCSDFGPERNVGTGADRHAPTQIG